MIRPRQSNDSTCSLEDRKPKAAGERAGDSGKINKHGFQEVEINQLLLVLSMDFKITNLLAQRNNHLNQQMSMTNTSIAYDAKRHASVMKSIAILTILFLPATFTSVSPNISIIWMQSVNGFYRPCSPLQLLLLLNHRRLCIGQSPYH